MEAVKSHSNDLQAIRGRLRIDAAKAWDKGDKRALTRLAFLERAVNYAIMLGEGEKVPN
jgi:hypothetical protein